MQMFFSFSIRTVLFFDKITFVSIYLFISGKKKNWIRWLDHKQIIFKTYWNVIKNDLIKKPNIICKIIKWLSVFCN